MHAENIFRKTSERHLKEVGKAELISFFEDELKKKCTFSPVQREEFFILLDIKSIPWYLT
ncbi:MAG: hypothetical protein D3911_02195 [Candidatus Electrothrix sp. AW3_4]|nr:hypothetical protein [Candidatus Electrothrix gigas]